MVRSILLLAVAVLFFAYSVYLRNQQVALPPAEIIGAIESNIEGEMRQLRREADVILKSEKDKVVWPVVKNTFYLHDTTGVIKWNTNRFCPEPFTFFPDSIVYHHSGSSHYLLKQRHLGNQVYLTGYLSLQEGFPIQNQYISTRLNKDIFPANTSFDFSGGIFPVHVKGNVVFPISINAVAATRKFETESWLVFSIGSLFLLTFIVSTVKKLLASKKNWLAAAVILSALLSFRIFMVYGQFPGITSEGFIFNPKVFASSSFSDSLGNLLFNTIALFIASIGFFIFLRKPTYLGWRRMPAATRFAALVVLMVLCFASQLLPFLYLETIYHNSAINLDISQQLYFDEVRWLGLACIILSSATGFFFLFTFFKLAVWGTLSEWTLFLISLVIAIAVVFSYHFLTERNYEIPILLTAVNLALLYGGTVLVNVKFISRRPFSLVLLTLIIFGLQAALAVRLLGIERQREAMIKFANTFLIERDVLGEYLLDQAITKIESDDFIRQQILYPFNRLGTISQKIKNYHLNSYFDKYDTRVYLFDNRGQGMGESGDGQASDLASLIQDFVPLAGNTNYRGIYFVNGPSPGQSIGGNQFLRRYIAVVPIRYHVSSYIVLDLTLRQFLPVAVFPKLLLDSRFSEYAKSSSYSFALFNMGQLTSSSGYFKYRASPLATELGNPALYRVGIDLEDYFHVAIEGLNGQVIIMSAPSYRSIRVMANFAFYFLVGLVLVLIGYLALNSKIVKVVALSYSDRIQLYVYLAVVLPLIVIAITILRISSNSETQRIEDESASKANHLAISLAATLEGPLENLQPELARQAQATGVDATIFSTKGVLLASSQPGIFSAQLISRFIQPGALQKIAEGNNLFALDDDVGGLKFRTTFASVRSRTTGHVLAVLSIPFFESQESTERAQVQLVSNILIVFVFVLIGFYGLSFFALNWLTAPLRVIASSLKRTTFSGTNRKLTWKSSDDEIGAMVNEYNGMIDKLETSRAELEKRQREAAWREMARQVAHEIKNPLTPIKLTLQQMERTVQEGRSEPKKIIDSVKSVLHQVDILNEIASSFSAFAQMPELKLEKVNIIELLRDTVSLFANSTDGKVVFHSAEGGPIMVMADRKLFSRIFSNIILNALQSRKLNEELVVSIRVTRDNANWVIFFSDNGVGISPEIKDKVFIPYFSTKEAGSGLGLAIAKQGIEQAGGRISCESSLGTGTTFCISLPSLP
jgi:two-component system, NtrC family, nitrogen regulation sensor histidine kinase NtrY